MVLTGISEGCWTVPMVFGDLTSSKLCVHPFDGRLGCGVTLESSPVRKVSTCATVRVLNLRGIDEARSKNPKHCIPQCENG